MLAYPGEVAMNEVKITEDIRKCIEENLNAGYKIEVKVLEFKDGRKEVALYRTYSSRIKPRER